MMETNYAYNKRRCDFGRQCFFYDDGPKLLDNLPPSKLHAEEYIRQNPVSRSTQCSEVFAESECNTIRAEFSDRGCNHSEGGWPKDVNPLDIEQTLRYRKKVEKDEMYIHTILNLSQAMEHCILQNNAVNIYEKYFGEDEATSLVDRASSRTVNVYRDPTRGTKRPVTHISWSPDGGTKLAVTHCNLEFQRMPNTLSTASYIWEVENPNKPQLMLKTSVPITCLEYNPKDPNSLVSGMFSGQVACWDARKGPEPVEMSVLANSHRDPTHDIIWTSSKSGTEFFSSSFDGTIKWWDLRKISEPFEELILDLAHPDEMNLGRALGISCLEYESTIPTRFMVGTENGAVISGNRKGKLPSEKIAGRFNAHIGPVYALQRNPAFVKNFITVGDWTIRIWSEECRESSIMWTKHHKVFLTHGSWSPTRFSTFYVTKADGTIDAWDILQKQKEPCLSVKLADCALTCLRNHDQGRLVAVGSALGTAYLVEFSENMAMNQKNDKALLTAMLERESRREKILEARIREIRLKLRTKAGEKERDSLTKDSKGSLPTVAAIPTETPTDIAERDFWTCINKEMASFAVPEEEEEAEAAEDVPFESVPIEEPEPVE